MLGEYVDSGYRTSKDRIIYSLKSNGRYQLIVLGCGTVGLIYVLWENGFHGASVKSLVMALAYCVGLIQAVLLLGHGLVTVPRHFFRSYENRLQRIQTKAPRVKEKRDDAITELEDLNRHIEELKSRKRGLSRDMEDWIDEIAEGGQHSILIPSAIIPSHNRVQPVPAIITEGYLADILRRLNRAQHKVIRFTYEWSYLVNASQNLQRIIDSKLSQRLEPSKDTQTFWTRNNMLSPYLGYLLHHKVIPIIRIMYGIFLTIASLSIIWSELVKTIAPQISIISLTVVRYHGNDPKVGFTGQVIAFLWIMYMCTCTLSSLQDIKVWGNRALVRRNTYYESACWYSLQVAKLTVPLTYNFLTFTPPKVHQETIFYKFLGQLIVLTPLGKGFDYFFPILILIPAAATLFHLYSRVKKVFGYGVFEDDGEDSSYGSGTWREGRQLIEQEIQDRDHTGSSGLPTRSQIQRSAEEPRLERGRPTIYVPPGENRGTSERQANRLAAATQAAEDADENIFSEFAHRFRNTIENVDRPDWLPEFGKRPKWMGGQDGDQDIRGQSSSNNESNGISRLFGGGRSSSTGRIRL